MGVVVHVELVTGSAEQMQALINERLELVPRWDLPLGICAYPTHVNPEPNGTEWVAVISYQCEEMEAEPPAPEPVDEPAYSPPGQQMAVGTAVRDVHHPGIDWYS